MNKTETYPSISIAISTKDRREDLMNVLNSIKEVDYPKDKLEIIVVEETHNAQEIEGVKYVSIPVENRGFGYTRNVAVKNASNEIIVFTDDDCIVTEDWLKEIVSPLIKDEGVAGVAGGVLVKNCKTIGYCENVIGFPNGGLIRIHNSKGNIVETKELSTCNCAYRRKVFEKLGLFRIDTKYSGEDYEFAKRVNRHYRCVFYPDAVVYHKPRESLIKIFKWFVRRGISEWFIGKMKIRSIWKHILYYLQSSLLLKLMVIILILNLFNWDKFWVYFILFALFYLLLLLRYRFQLHYHLGWKAFFLTPVVKWVMDLGMDFGMLIGGFVLWKSYQQK